jgi:aromatic-amino-acid transaminase
MPPNVQPLIRPEPTGDDLTFPLHRAAIVLQQQGGRHVIDGTLGVLLDDDGRLIMLPSVRRALAELPPEDWAPYAPIAGESAYLEAVRGQVFGGDLETAETVAAVATPGATGALKLAVDVFLDAGETALTTSHHWQPYADIAAQQQRRLATFDMFAAAGGGCLGDQALNVEALDGALAGIISQQDRALLILNDPCHNPTGYSMTAADWAAVAAVVEARARQAPVTVLLDAAYADYAAAGLSLARGAFARLSGRVVVAVAWSASKSLTAYGLRAGALLAIPADPSGHRQLALRLQQASLAGWGNCGRGAMLVVERLLREPELASAVTAERRGVIDMLDDRARRFRRAAQRHGLVHPRHDRGFFATVLVRQPERVAAALREQGAFVVPGCGSLRIALSAVATNDVAPLMAAISRCVGDVEGSGT